MKRLRPVIHGPCLCPMHNKGSTLKEYLIPKGLHGIAQSQRMATKMAGKK